MGGGGIMGNCPGCFPPPIKYLIIRIDENKNRKKYKYFTM